MSDWSAPDVVAWMNEAFALQQNLYRRLGDRKWDTWDKSDTTILQRKVGFAMLFLPENLPHENNNFTGYSETQLNEIKRVADFILTKAKGHSLIHFACVFFFGKIKEKRFCVPVFKVKGTENKTLFVDLDCRVCDNWNDYLESNLLPKSLYCYPHEGLYKGINGQVLVDFRTSPACDLDDNTTTPILADRYFFNPNIKLNDSEGRADLLGIEGNDLDITEDCMLANITRTVANRSVANKALRIKFGVVTNRSLTVNGQETLYDFISVVDKVNKGPLTDLKIFNFSTSVLFFSNCLFVADSIQGIIEKTQEQVLNYHCKNLSDAQIEEHFRLSEQVQGETQMHKNTETIKAIYRIDNKNTFYESLVNVRGQLEGHQVQFSTEEPGLVDINDELHIAPNKLAEISTDNFQKIIDATTKVNDGTMSDTVYRKSIETILKINRLKMEYQRREAIVFLEEVFNTDNIKTVNIGDQKIFENLTPSELDRLTDVMKDSGNNYNPTIVEIANEFAKMRGCETPRDYCNYVEFTTKYLSSLKTQKEVTFQSAIDNAKKLENFDQNEFIRQYGIKGKRADHFKRQVFDDFYTNRVESFNALLQRYTDLENTVLPLNASIEPNFESDTSAVYHCFKHNRFGDDELTPKKYLEIPKELAQELYRRSEQLNQQGDINVITFTNPSRGAVCIVFEKLEDGTQSLATVYYERRHINRLNR